MEKTNREKAIKWWSNLDYYSKVNLNISYHGTDRSINSLTGREIEEIWYKETQEFYNPDVVEMAQSRDMVLEEMEEKEKQSKIDFERLNLTRLWLENQHNDFESRLFQMCTREEIKNLIEFLTKLSQSSSFAHKAHKELQRLMR